VLIDRIGQMAQQGPVKSSATKASLPPPPIVPAASYVESKTSPLSAFIPNNKSIEEEFGDIGGGEDEATVALNGRPPPRGVPSRYSGTIPPPAPSQPPSPWLPGAERPRHDSARPSAFARSDAHNPRYDTVPPPPGVPNIGGSLAGQSVSQRAATTRPRPRPA